MGPPCPPPGSAPAMDLPTDPPVPFTCVFEEAPNVTEVEVTQMALCHVHCIDQVAMAICRYHQ